MVISVYTHGSELRKIVKIPAPDIIGKPETTGAATIGLTVTCKEKVEYAFFICSDLAQEIVAAVFAKGYIYNNEAVGTAQRSNLIGNTFRFNRSVFAFGVFYLIKVKAIALGHELPMCIGQNGGAHQVVPHHFGTEKHCIGCIIARTASCILTHKQCIVLGM